MDYRALKEKVGDDPHDLAAEIQIDSIPAALRVAMLFEAFEDLRSYGMVMYLKHEFDAGDAELRTGILSKFRSCLESQDEGLVQEVLYALWCDYFEDPATVEEAWRHLAGTGSPPLLLRRLLPRAGPVPWHLKKPLLDSLVLDRKWHPSIFECLLYSAFDAYGKIDKADAGRLLGRLELAPEVEHLEKLRSALRGAAAKE